jgi:hypothetical protein
MLIYSYVIKHDIYITVGRGGDMFGWLGWKQGMPLWWSYQLNKDMKEDVEEIFEGIAHTIGWTC